MGTPSHIVIGLGFGDEGKGTIVDALVRKTGASTVVRFNGGAQAAHNVISPSGVHHTFAQWGSGTLAGADTILTEDVIIDPMAMVPEAVHLRQQCGISDPFSRLIVDERAMVVTPFHQAMNRIREWARGDHPHGTCGMGIGEVMEDARRYDEPSPDYILRAGDLLEPDRLEWKVRGIAMEKSAEAIRLLRGSVPELLVKERELLLNGAEYMRDSVITQMLMVGRLLKIASWDQIAPIVAAGNVVFEGAQGVLLDEWHGFHPHTTWSRTTSQNARRLLKDAGATDSPIVIGVTRAYGTRHGAGPFPSEDVTAEAPEGEHNKRNRQGRFRVGALDAVLLKYAIAADGRVSRLAVTCLDHADAQRTPVVAYRPNDDVFGKIAIAQLVPNTNHHVGETVQLGLQASRGRMLACVDPILDLRPWNVATFAEYTGLPVCVESHGPTAEDKKWIAE